jgi:hypothetical protein
MKLVKAEYKIGEWEYKNLLAQDLNIEKAIKSELVNKFANHIEEENLLTFTFGEERDQLELTLKAELKGYVMEQEKYSELVSIINQMENMYNLGDLQMWENLKQILTINK